ncbi:GSCOCG00006731001-RA-CDS [Cotesia congregata]|nr:GSCOCG00006731001-RA-CDS [Cotesia congregata]
MSVDRRECSRTFCNDEGMCSQSCWTRPALVDYAFSRSELKRFSDWFKVTAEQFEDSDYDAFIYSFPGYLTEGLWNPRTVWSLSSGTVCQSKPGAIVSNKFGYSVYAFSIELAYLLGLTHNEDNVDSHWYTHEELDINWYKIIDWRNQTADIVKDNYQHGKYSCLKKPVKKNDDYDDE